MNYTREFKIKFTSKRKYADALCNGSFFMHPAHYYQALQNGRGDALEGAFSHLYIPEKRLYLPIYSLYVVYEDQVHDHRITIDARMMDHFGSYYATIFKWEDWALFMQSHCFTQTYAYGLVTYQDMNLETFTRLVNNHRYEHLLTKRPSYHYQHEFRLIIDDPLSKEEMMIGKMYHATTLIPKGTIVDMKKCLKDHDYFMIDMNGAMIYCDYEDLMS